jgi:hypothetical protein
VRGACLQVVRRISDVRKLKTANRSCPSGLGWPGSAAYHVALTLASALPMMPGRGACRSPSLHERGWTAALRRAVFGVAVASTLVSVRVLQTRSLACISLCAWHASVSRTFTHCGNLASQSSPPELLVQSRCPSHATLARSVSFGFRACSVRATCCHVPRASTL